MSSLMQVVTSLPPFWKWNCSHILLRLNFSNDNYVFISDKCQFSSRINFHYFWIENVVIAFNKVITCLYVKFLSRVTRSPHFRPISIYTYLNGFNINYFNRVCNKKPYLNLIRKNATYMDFRHSYGKLTLLDLAECLCKIFPYETVSEYTYGTVIWKDTHVWHCYMERKLPCRIAFVSTILCRAVNVCLLFLRSSFGKLSPWGVALVC